MIRATLALAAILAILAPPARSGSAPEAVAQYGPADAPQTLLVRGATDISTFGPVVEAFAARNPLIRVTLEQWNSIDLFDLALAECRAGRTEADLLISSAVDLKVKLVNEGCARPHVSALADALPPDRNWRNELIGVTQEPAVIVYNRALLPEALRPTSRFDLLDVLRQPDNPFAGGRIATYDIHASGVGYLFAFVDSRQASTFGSLIEAFGRLGAVATCCSAEIIQGVRSGRYLLAYNVLGSYALDLARDHPELEVVAPSDYTLVLSRAVMIPRQSDAAEDAGRLIDFLLSPPGQAALAANHLIVQIGEGEDIAFPRDSVAARRPIPLSPVLLLGLDRQERERFLTAWDTALARGHRPGP